MGHSHILSEVTNSEHPTWVPNFARSQIQSLTLIGNHKDPACYQSIPNWHTQQSV